ncbi:hypothetical protein Btru_039467 [Bulinus truncatus]|nr:hypothetical protein Btru_039467 [Bulinus truncatus]
MCSTASENNSPRLLFIAIKPASNVPSYNEKSQTNSNHSKMFLSVFILLQCITVVIFAQRTCHGNVNNLHPSGKASGGVAASEADVAYDLRALEKQKQCYQASADRNCIQASVIAAIASRESRGGYLLVATGGWGSSGNAWGIMQCDVRYSGLPCTSVAWDSCEHIEMLVNRLLVPYFNQFMTNFPPGPWIKLYKTQQYVHHV